VDKRARRITDESERGRRHPYRLHDESYLNTNLPMMVTCTVKRRWPVVVDDTADTVAEVLVATSERRDAVLHGFCVMPDHLHFLIHLAADDTPPRFLRYFKGEASRRINVLWGMPGAFRWQRSYWDTFADDAEALADQMRYMLANPVRRGLCACPEDWTHSADFRPGSGWRSERT
jgi:REP element-mobilizing transposase RayT